MKTRLLSFLFPLLLTTAVVVAGVAYQDKLFTTNDSYGRLQLALKGINPFLQKGSRIYVTDHSGEELFHAQLQIFLPFNHIVWKDTVNGLEDSLLTITKEEDAYTNINKTRLRITHHTVWCQTGGGGYAANLWLKSR